ncbi:acetylornithine deacetylase [Curvivirga sp.]|uniref:acetylornithine deacetylase n=1 Tax=Curvivirga sp. TaxID=2856848 RepID=UPI003B59C61A
MKTKEILEKLLSFQTVSLSPNMELIHFIGNLLADHNIEAQIIGEETGTRANLYATVYGTELTVETASTGGVVLSGHSDVVPIAGQNWTVDPFTLTEKDSRYYGRGTADMKGFLASAIRTCLIASKQPLKTPLHLAVSFDEEIGCVGVRHLIERLKDAPMKPHFCIIGEPTSLGVATGHKGKTALRATCIGLEGHSAMAPNFLNALHLGADLIKALQDIQDDLAKNGAQDNDYDIPCSTIHVGKMSGGVALNIVPNECILDFEIRNLAADKPEDIIQRVKDAAKLITENAREKADCADIKIEVVNSYPGLNTNPGADIVSFVKSLRGENKNFKIAFGTEGGLFDQILNIPTVVCGPGSMDQGHKPDEFVSVEQIELCDQMLDRLVERLIEGL